MLMLVLPALVRMQNQICMIWYFRKCFFKHVCCLCKVRMAAQIIRNDFSIVKINNWRQIQFYAEQCKFRNIGDPLLIWLICLEITLKKIRRNPADFSCIVSTTIILNSGVYLLFGFPLGIKMSPFVRFQIGIFLLYHIV